MSTPIKPYGDGNNSTPATSDIFKELPLKTKKPPYNLAGGTIDEDPEKGNITSPTTGSSKTIPLPIDLPSLLKTPEKPETPSIENNNIPSTTIPSLPTDNQSSPKKTLSEISRDSTTLKGLLPVVKGNGVSFFAQGNGNGVNLYGAGVNINDVSFSFAFVPITGDWRADVTISSNSSTKSPTPGNIVKSPPNLTNSSGFSSVNNLNPLPPLTNSNEIREIIKSYTEMVAAAAGNVINSKVPVGGEALTSYLSNLNEMLSRIQGVVRSLKDVKDFDALIAQEFKSDSSRGLAPSLKSELVGIQSKINSKINDIEKKFSEYQKLSSGPKNDTNNARLQALASELSTLTGVLLGDDKLLKNDGPLLIQDYLTELKNLNEKLTRFNRQPWLSQQPLKNNMTS